MHCACAELSAPKTVAIATIAIVAARITTTNAAIGLMLNLRPKPGAELTPYPILVLVLRQLKRVQCGVMIFGGL
jgi:hypothetical protein